MKKSNPVICLVALLTLALATCRILKTCIPFGVLPRLDIANMVLLSGLSLVADHWLRGSAGKPALWMPVVAALAFGLLPLAAGFAGLTESLLLAVTGGVVYGITAWIYDSMADRLADRPMAKAAPFLSILGLYLAAQCFQGILL